MAKHRIPQPGLFDEPSPAAPVAAPKVERPWREVPQALFLSWSPVHQLIYCWKRDMDSARQAEERGEDSEWFRWRGERYRDDAEALEPTSTVPF